MSLADFADKIAAYAQQYGIPTDLFSNLVQTESSGNQLAYNASSGAAGLTQLLPSTQASLGVQDPFDPDQSLNAGASLLASFYAQTGSWSSALTKYGGFVNADPTSYLASILSGTSQATTATPSTASASATPTSTSLIGAATNVLNSTESYLGGASVPLDILSVLLGIAMIVIGGALFVAPRVADAVLGGASKVNKVKRAAGTLGII